MTSLKGKTIWSLIWKLFEQGGTAVVTLLVQIVLARLLAPEDFGMLAIMLVFINVGNVIVQSGLNTAIIQSPDATEQDYSTVFWMSFVLSLVLYGVIFCIAPVVADFYQMPQSIMPLRVLTLVLIVNSYNSIQEAIVARQMEFQKTFAATLAAGLISGTVGIAMAFLGWGIWALVAQQLVQQGCKCLVLAIQVPWKPRFEFSRARALTLFRFGWKLLASGLLNQGYQSLADLIIGKVFTKTDLGYVSQGKKYPYALGCLLDGAIQPVMLSAVSKVQSDLAMAKRLMRRALKTSTFLVMPAMALFAAAAEPIVRVLLGDQWLPSVPFLQAYCVVYALLPIHSTNLQTLNGLGRSDLFLKLEIVKTAICATVLVTVVFVFQDLMAVMAGYVVGGIICTFINAFPSKRVVGYSYGEQLRDIAPALLMSVFCGFAVYLLTALGLNDIVTILLQVACMAVLYCLIAKVFHIEEFEYLTNTVKEMKAKRL